MGKEIKALYYSKGLPPPKGKGEHTLPFHKIASAMIASGVPKNEAYATAMKRLGRNKAVNKSHWRSGNMTNAKTKTNKGNMGSK